MSAIPVLPDTAPFTPEQRAWLNGFFAGIFSRGPAPAIAAGAPARVLAPLTILFGSQTGTAEGLARRAGKMAAQRGFAPTILDMGEIDLPRLLAEKNVLLITSTYGDGEPPDNAKALHDAVRAATAGGQRSCSGLRFSVCALGDTNYTQFCRCGRDFDEALEKLGGARIEPRVECDLEYEEPFLRWIGAALAAFAPSSANPVPTLEATTPAPAAPSTEPVASYSKKNPYPALLVTSRTLNALGSTKQVCHVEFSLGDSNLRYEAGDALGVIAQNCPTLVAEVLAALGCDGEEAVPAPDGGTASLRHALTTLYDLGKPPAGLLGLFSPALAGHAGEVSLSSGPQVIDLLLARRDLRIPAADFVRALRKLQPRLYSISSSPRAHSGQVHLTVGAVRYDLLGRARKGVCSTFLADRAPAGTSRVGVFVHSNPAFRLPANGDTPVIMVGPGTGIAPFRAFLHERRASGARGRNWLFFGDQRSETDFLYRDELDAFRQDGTLNRLDTAFSRDQSEKIYVQHRMLEQAGELYAWLAAGAHFYVCGDASRMAADVDVALRQVIETAGDRSADQAAAYVQALKTAKRYARDVY